MENKNLNNQVQNNSRKIGFVLVILGLLLIGVAVYKLYIDKPNTTEPKDDNTQDNENDNIIVSGDQSYKSKDGKYTFKLLENGKAFINEKEVNVIDKEENNRYIEIGGDFDPSPKFISRLGFVLDKKTKLIVESPYYDETDKSSECGFEDYGEYARFCDRCYGFNVLNINNWNFFEISSEVGSSDIYTTSWKKLGSIDIDKINYDEKGIYVCNSPFESTCTSGETKYDVNGNVVND